MLQTITITGFRGLRDQTISLGTTNLFTGMNGAGKTTILNAVRLALFGHCAWTDARGSGAKALITEGAKAASIVLDGQTKAGQSITLRYNIGKAIEVSLWRKDTGEILAEGHDAIWEALGYDRKAAEVACFPENVITSEGLGASLVAHLGASMTGEDAVVYAEKTIKDRDLHTGVTAYLGVLDLPTTPGMWQAFGEEAFRRRTDLGRELKKIKANEEDFSAPSQPTDEDGQPIDPAAIPNIKVSLTEIQGQRAELLKESGAAEAMAQIDEVEETSDQLLDKLSHWREAKERADAAKVAREEQIEAVNQTALVQQEAERRAEKRQFEAETLLSQAEEAVQKFDGESCPVCERAWTVQSRRAAQSEILVEVGKMKDVIKKAKESKALAFKELLRLGPEVETIKGMVKESVSRAAEAVEAIQKINNKISLLQSREMIVGAGRTLEAIKQDLHTADERIHKGEKVLEAIKTYADWQGQHKRREELEAEISVLGWCSDAFKKGRFQESRIKGPLDEFVALCSAEMARFGYGLGYTMTDKGVALDLIQLADYQKERTLFPLKQASRGEIMMAKFAIARVFGEAGGIAILDNIDALDGKARPELIARMKELDGMTVLAAAAYGRSETAVLPEMQEALTPVKVHWVEAGQLSTTE